MIAFATATLQEDNYRRQRRSIMKHGPSTLQNLEQTRAKA